MKKSKLNLLMAILLLSFTVHAQELSRSVFASGGETVASGELELSWTIGQSGLVGSFSQNTLSLNVGFQQFNELGTYVAEISALASIEVFPNPFREDFYFNLKSRYNGEVAYSLYDNNGKIVLQDNSVPVSAGFCEKRISLPDRPPGIYNLTLFFFPDNHSPEHFSIKLIKL